MADAGSRTTTRARMTNGNDRGMVGICGGPETNLASRSRAVRTVFVRRLAACRIPAERAAAALRGFALASLTGISGGPWRAPPPLPSPHKGERLKAETWPAQ